MISFTIVLLGFAGFAFSWLGGFIIGRLTK